MWVGLDQPKTIFDRAYGSTMALPIWADVMKTAERLGYEANGLDSSPPFSEARLCKSSGKRATRGCEIKGTAYTESQPAAKLPPEGDFCHEHDDVIAESVDKPLKAVPVDPNTPVDTSTAPRAQPVESDEVPRAIPVEEEEIPRALPVD